MKRGFTVVEVLITLIVIGILLGLGTVGLRATLANGRDSERKSDIETIARGLEQRYTNGNAKKALPPSDIYYPNPTSHGKGYYPGINEFYHMEGGQRGSFVPETIVGGYMIGNLPGISGSSLITPSGNKFGQVCVYACQPAGNDAQLVTAFNHPTEGRDRYLYEGVDPSGIVCSNGNCMAFNLYWVSETDQSLLPGYTIPGLKVVRSKHQ